MRSKEKAAITVKGHRTARTRGLRTVNGTGVIQIQTELSASGDKKTKAEPTRLRRRRCHTAAVACFYCECVKESL